MTVCGIGSNEWITIVMYGNVVEGRFMHSIQQCGDNLVVFGGTNFTKFFDSQVLTVISFSKIGELLTWCR